MFGSLLLCDVENVEAAVRRTDGNGQCFQSWYEFTNLRHSNDHFAFLLGRCPTSAVHFSVVFELQYLAFISQLGLRQVFLFVCLFFSTGDQTHDLTLARQVLMLLS